MNLQLTGDQILLRESFDKLFRKEATTARVRAAEPVGFDRELWQQLVAMGVPLLRVPESTDGAGLGLLEAAILAEQVGCYLAPVPVLEAMICGRLLAAPDDRRAAEWLRAQARGEAIVTLALAKVESTQPEQIVPAGAIAHAVICLRGTELILVGGGPREPLQNLGCAPLARWRFDDDNPLVLAQGDRASKLYYGAVEEWKLLMAAALAGLARRALEIAAAYSCERKAFGKLIGSYQGLAHPLADAITDVEGAAMLVQYAIWSIATQRHEAAAIISAAYWWATRVSSRAVALALRVHGGYGLTLDYDVQLYFRRAKTWPLAAGDPGVELDRLSTRLWGGDTEAALPPAGLVEIDFSYGADTEALEATTRRFFAENLTDELRAHAHHSWAGRHPEFNRKLAQAGLLLPDWPEQYGGQGRNLYDMTAVARVFHEIGWGRSDIGVIDIVGKVLLRFGSEPAKAEILPLLTSGERAACLGFSEPACGSDVFAATTRAVREGDNWIINGQKIFTSGANLANYVLLLTRTDPNLPKHAGLTIFIVPLNSPGIEIQPIYTLADERTNSVYYDNVRVPDKYRVGEINGGVKVMAESLPKEQDGSTVSWKQFQMLETAASWARQTRRGGRLAIEQTDVRNRLTKAWVDARIADLLSRRSLWRTVEGLDDRSAAPMSKLFATDNYIRDSADLLDLMAPDSLLSEADQLYTVELDYRLSQANSIYGGTNEIMRSVIAEVALKMPRSR